MSDDITHTLYSTQDLLGVYSRLEPTQNFWLRFFPGLHTSDSETIRWNKITKKKYLAPLVLPTNQGRPVYTGAETVESIKPAYVKPKDTVSGAAMLTRRAGLGELGQARPLTPQERYSASIADILAQHREAIERRWEWMAAQAILYGQVALEDDSYPKAVVDFRRNANQTVVLTSGNRWGDSGVSIPDNIESWNDIMVDAKFGGAATDLIMGTKAWKIFRDDAKIKDLLKTDYRQTSATSLDLGVGNGEKAQHKGNLSQNMRVWVYSDYYEAANGTSVPYMDPRDVLLIGQNVEGVKAFGAILDTKANFQSLPIFPKMWDENDPSATILMTQSAPIMVPINPNNTFRARVVA